MGFFYKHIMPPLMSKSVGKKAFTNNPYLGMVIDALDSDVIADELFRVGMAYYEGAYMLPKDTDKALSYFRKHPNGMCNVARQCMAKNVKDYERARVLFEEASKSGNEHAFYGLAVIYYQGLGVTKDVKKHGSI